MKRRLMSNILLQSLRHISVRHPSTGDTFLMPRNLQPASVASRGDIVEYFVEDARPVHPGSATGYIERFIHSEIYKRYPEVNSVIHSHAPSILPYRITGRAHDHSIASLFLLTSFRLLDRYSFASLCSHEWSPWQKVAKFDISRFYAEDDVRDLLIRNERLGAQLALLFSANEKILTNSVVLMRGQGMTVVGGIVKQSVFRAIYTAENAKVQTTATTLQVATKGESVQYLDASELLLTATMGDQSSQRPWTLWAREVEVSPFYMNAG